MPRDEQGRWIPEPHKANSYTENERSAAAKVMGDFDKARSPTREEAVPQIQPEREAATKIMSRELTPNGSRTVLRNTPAGQQREDAAREHAKSYQMQALTRQQENNKEHDLTKSFNKEAQKINVNERDLER